MDSAIGDMPLRVSWIQGGSFNWQERWIMGMPRTVGFAID